MTDTRFKKGEMSKGVTFKKGGIPWNKGKKMSPEYCAKISEVQKGRKQTPEHIAARFKNKTGTGLDRKSYRYRKWKQNVHERDDYKCVKCGSDKKLHAHHIEKYDIDIELKFDLNNGITLCATCHAREHNQEEDKGFKKGRIPPNKGTKLISAPGEKRVYTKIY